MAAEFIGLLRDIRDVKYPDIVSKHTATISAAAAVAIQSAAVESAFTTLEPHLAAIDAAVINAQNSQASATAAAASQTAAAGSAAQALASLQTLTNEVVLAQSAAASAVSAKNTAESYQNKAGEWADKMDGEVVSGRYSARYWADYAANNVNGMVYNNTATYNFPDAVVYIDGKVYRCISTNVVGVAPISDPAKWVVLGGVTAASQLAFAPTGDIQSQNVQAAITEVRDDTDTKLTAKADVSTVNSALALKADTSAMSSALALKADGSYVDQLISNLVGAAPSTLNTLQELAAAIGNDPSFSSTISTAIAAKQATISGAASSITTSNLSTSKALVSDGSGKVAAHGTTTSTEIGYLAGVTSAVQTQITNAQNTANSAQSTANAKIGAANYASADGTVGGTIKARINGSTLYLTTNGANA